MLDHIRRHRRLSGCFERLDFVAANHSTSAVGLQQLNPLRTLRSQDAGYDAARAVVRRADSEPIVVLSVEHLLERIYRSALPEREVLQ